MNVGNLIGIIILFFLIGYLIGGILFGLIVSKAQGVDIRNLGSGNVGATNVTRNIGMISGFIVTVLDFFKSWISTFFCLLIYKSLKTAIGDDSAYTNAGVIVYLGGFAAVIGHCFPISYFYALVKYKFNFEIAKKYSGGKGVASTAGFAASISPWMFFICFVLFWSICLISKYVSLASIVTTLLLPIWTLIPYLDYFYVMNMVQADIFNNFPPFSSPFKIVDTISYNNHWWYILVIFIFELIAVCLVVFRHKENIVRLLKKEERKIKFGSKKTA